MIFSSFTSRAYFSESACASVQSASGGPPMPSSEFLVKFSRNVARDEAARIELERRGYRVLTFWQCEVEANLEVTDTLAALRPS